MRSADTRRCPTCAICVYLWPHMKHRDGRSWAGCRQIESGSRRLASVLMVLVACLAAMAQGGGKAEPNRVAFKPGTFSQTISGTVRGDEQAEYVLAAQQGQRLSVTLTSVPAKSSIFELLGENHERLGLASNAHVDYSGTLTTTGDYFVTVKRPTTSKGSSRYKLTLTLR